MPSTEKLPSGRWRGVYRDVNGRKRTVKGTFAHKADAKNAATNAEVKSQRDPRPPVRLEVVKQAIAREQAVSQDGALGSASAVRDAIAGVIEAQGWQCGSALENRVARVLASFGFTPDHVAQQRKMGSYTIDFAWTAVKVALEVDGIHHHGPTSAAHDALRDADLRRAGWLVFRVNEADDDHLREQLARVVQVVCLLDPAMAAEVDGG